MHLKKLVILFIQQTERIRKILLGMHYRHIGLVELRSLYKRVEYIDYLIKVF